MMTRLPRVALTVVLLFLLPRVSAAAPRTDRARERRENLARFANGVVHPRTTAAFRKALQERGHLPAVQSVLRRPIPSLGAENFRSPEFSFAGGTVAELADWIIDRGLSVRPGSAAHLHLADLVREISVDPLPDALLPRPDPSFLGRVVSGASSPMPIADSAQNARIVNPLRRTTNRP